MAALARARFTHSIAERTGNDDLLERVLAGVQLQVHEMRSTLTRAVDPLERLRSAGDLSPDLSTDAQTVATEFNSVIAHLGELQLLLAAAVQSLVAVDHAQRGLDAGCDSRDQPRGRCM